MMNYDEIFRAGTIPGAVIDRALGTLGDIVAGTCDLRAVRHPLGFLCFPIERRATCGICVHVWSPQIEPAESTTSEMHAHSWELLSQVLSGELHNRRLAVLDDKPTYRVFEVHSQDDADELRATSRLVRCRIAGHDVNRRGDTYTLAAGSFHATVAEAATTVAVGMARPGLADLSLGRIDGCSHFVRRERCDRASTVMAASSVAEQLSELGLMNGNR
jgi:hypothetical protein